MENKRQRIVRGGKENGTQLKWIIAKRREFQM